MFTPTYRKNAATHAHRGDTIVAILLTFAGGFLCFWLTVKTHRDICLHNLELIDAGTESWGAGVCGKRGDAVDVKTIAVEYMKAHKLPSCPSGGTYTIPALGLSPQCSVHGALWEGQSTFPPKWEPGYLEAVQHAVAR